MLGYAVILSMYGGGFATIPAYLRDLFGTMQVGAIHGRLLTAWSTAGVLGPVLVNYIREYEIAHGVAKADAYTTTMYIMAGLLVVGFVCNLLVRPVDEQASRAERKRPHAGGRMRARLVAVLGSGGPATRLGRVAGLQEVARSLSLADCPASRRLPTCVGGFATGSTRARYLTVNSFTMPCSMCALPSFASGTKQTST